MGRVLKAVKKWNAFRDTPVTGFNNSVGQTMSPRQSRAPARYFSDRSIVDAIYVRMAIDVASVEFFHAMLDTKTGTAIDTVEDDLNECLQLSPNIDQSAQHFKMDAVMTMFRQGEAAIVPIEADADIANTAGYNISDMRVGRVVAWGAQKVTVEVYDDRESSTQGEDYVQGGITKQITLPKRDVAIVENPFYDVMNAPNGLLQRLLRKLAILDGIDEAAGSGKLDLIFQLPYTVRGDSRQKQAEVRRQALAEQLKDDELGIGYIDVSEKVIQLNRPVDNKMLEQIEYLHAEVRSELGINEKIMNNTASRDEVHQYMDRTIEPIANAMALEMKRKFLTKTARTQGHSIEIYRDPLKLIPIGELAEIADKLLRNRLVTVNEFRPKIGLRPSKEESANMLINPNMPTDDQLPASEIPPEEEVKDDTKLPAGDQGPAGGAPALGDQ